MLHFSRYFFYCNSTGYKWYYCTKSGTANLWYYFAIGSMIGTGSAIRYALAKATDQQEAKIYFSNALIWDVIVSVIFIAAGLFFQDKLCE